MNEIPIAQVYPIFYIEYNTDSELKSKIDMLSAPVNSGDGNAGYSDLPVNGYGIIFSSNDKKYQYAYDFDTFKKLVIECENPLSEEQISKIVKNFLPFGQDILYNRKLGIYCYFVGSDASDLTKSVINTYRRMENQMKRNLNANQVQLKKLPNYTGNYLDYSDVDTFASIIPPSETEVIAIQMESVKPIKESKDGIDYYPVFKIELHGIEDEETVSAIKKYMSKTFKIKFSKDDETALTNDEGAGRRYQEINCVNPIPEDSLESFGKSLKNYAKISGISVDTAGANQFVRVQVFDKMPSTTPGSQARDVTFDFSKKYLKADLDSIYAGVEDFINNTEHKPKGVK